MEHPQARLAGLGIPLTDDGVSVLLSSHALADLERVADYLIVLGAGGDSSAPGPTPYQFSRVKP